MTQNSDFKGAPLIDVQYLRNRSCNGILCDLSNGT